jgi:hypothetical protein
MALILKKLILKKKKTESRSHDWYQENKQRLSEERKRRYAEDPEYRKQALKASERQRRGERTPPIPPDAPISFAEAAKRTGIGVSTLHEWRRKKYFPDPKRHNGRRLWFTENQVQLLKNLKEFFRKDGRKPWKIKRDGLKEVVASIGAGWD